MKNLTRIAIVLLASFAIHNSQAQTNDSTLKGMNWRNIGPNRGGRSLGVAGSSKNKLEFILEQWVVVYGKLQTEV